MLTAALEVEQRHQDLLGQQQGEIYHEIDGPIFSDGIQARIVISNLDPEHLGKARAELQLVAQDGFTIYYSEPKDQLTGKWSAHCDGEKYLLTIN